MIEQPDDMLFRLEEATIEELHQAIRSGQTTLVGIVNHHIERVRAYNGVASMLVTEHGLPVADVPGAIRGMAPIRFPTETVKASSLLPDLDKYRGFLLEFGCMETIVSDPNI